jgi:hypothetical protein
VAAGASHIAMWNVHDLVPMNLRFPALRLVTPAQFLKEQNP